MCLSRHRRTRRPRLRPNTDWKMRFRGRDTVVSRPSECRLIHLPVCLRYSTCNILHSLLPSHHFCISIYLSQPGHHSAVVGFFFVFFFSTLLMSSRQFLLLRPSITLACVLLFRVPISQKNNFRPVCIRNQDKTVYFCRTLSLSEQSNTISNRVASERTISR